MKKIAVRILTVIFIINTIVISQVAFALPVDMEYRFRGTITMYEGSPNAYFGCEKVKIDPNNPKVAPLIINDRTFLPLRFVAESFDATVTWDQSSKSALLSVDGINARVTADENSILINGEKVTIDQAAFIREDRLYVPMRALAEQVFHKDIFYYNGLVIVGNSAGLFDESADKDILDRMINLLANQVKEPLELYIITDRYPDQQEGIGNTGFIDFNGNEIIPIGEGKAFNYYEGLTLGYGSIFYDKENNPVIKMPVTDNAQRISADNFREGMSVCAFFDEKDQVTYGAINKKGEITVEPNFKLLHNYSDGLALASYDGEKYGFINRNGQMVIDPKFIMQNNIHLDFDFSEGLAVIATGTEENGEYSYINKSGDIAIKGKFKKAGAFNYGVAAVSVEIDGQEKAGYINQKGEYIVPPQYDYTDDFSDGLGCDSNRDGTTVYFNRKGEIVLSFNGKENFNISSEFHEGLATISVKGNDGYRREGYMNKMGEIVIEPTFITASRFQGGLALVVTEDWHVGYIKQDGTFVWKRYL